MNSDSDLQLLVVILGVLSVLFVNCDRKSSSGPVVISSEFESENNQGDYGTNQPDVQSGETDVSRDGSRDTTNTSPYLCDDDGGTVPFRESDRDFAKPEPVEFDAAATRSEILRDFWGQLPENASRLAAPPRLRPGGEVIPEQLYAEEHENIVLYFATMFGQNDLGTSELTISLLLDFRPVKAVYKHWNAKRTKVLERVHGRGAQFEVDDDVELVDIVLDGDKLSRGRVHDLALSFRVDGDVRLGPVSRRIRVVHGGYDRGAHPCLKMGTKEPMTDREREIFSSRFFYDAMLLPSTPSAWEPGDAPVTADPGQTVELQYLLFTRASERYQPFALVPMVDGRPLEWRRFVVSPPLLKNLPPHAAARGSFSVNLPEEPGLYGVQLGTWPDPYLMPYDTPGKDIGVEKLTAGDGSNLVRYRVVDQ